MANKNPNLDNLTARGRLQNLSKKEVRAIASKGGKAKAEAYLELADPKVIEEYIKETDLQIKIEPLNSKIIKMKELTEDQIKECLKIKKESKKKKTFIKNLQIKTFIYKLLFS